MTIKPTPIDEQALDKAAREGYAVRCKTNGPRVLDQYASPDIMRKQLDDARVIVSEYLDALSVPAAAVVGEPEPIGYCSEYGLDKLASQAHHYCLSVSKAQENEFQFPIYASRISQQDAELERLREALKPFALAATIFEQEYGDRMKPDTGCNIKFAVLCQARAALRAKAEETPHG